MKLLCATRLVAAFFLILVLLFGPGPNQALEEAGSAGGPSAPLRTSDPGPARAFPRLSLGSGRELVYVGMFSSDARFRWSSKFTRFMDAMKAPSPDVTRPPIGSSEQAASQSGVPDWMLFSNERVADDVEPPAHAVKLPVAHSRAGSARDAVVSFAYGRPRLLRTPQQVTTDSRQRVILSDPGIPAVHVLDPKGKTSFSILGGQGHRLQAPAGVAVDGKDNIYVADSQRGMVLVYDQYGTFVRYIGNVHGENAYQGPAGIAISRKAGHLYLADGPRHLIFMLDLEGNLLKRVGRQWDETGKGELKRRKSTGAGEFNDPTEIAVGNDEVAVLDTAGTRVQIMDLECNLVGGFSVLSVSHGKVDRANGLGIDQDGNIYVSYAGASEVRVYRRDGGLLAVFGQAGSRMGEFSAPRGLWIDAGNRLYVADTENVRVQLFQLSTGDRGNQCLGRANGVHAAFACSDQQPH